MEMDWIKGFALDIMEKADAENLWKSRRLSQLSSVFYDRGAVEKQLEREDPLVYEFQELGAPEHAGDLAFGISRVFPGKVGDEYYMTRGHFHKVRDTAEVYLCLSGKGILLTEDAGGNCTPLELAPMNTAYSAKGFAHRSINTGDEPLVTFFVFRADAGHDYGTIETNGFQHIVLERNEKPEIIKHSK